MSEMVRAERLQELRAWGSQRRHALGRARPGVGARRTLWFGQVDVFYGVSTTWRPCRPTRLYVDGDLIGYREKAGKLYEMSLAMPPSNDATSAWCSNTSTFPAPDHAGQHHRGAGAREGRQQVGGHRPGPRTAPAGRAGGQRPTPIRHSCPAASSSGWRSPGAGHGLS